MTFGQLDQSFLRCLVHLPVSPKMVHNEWSLEFWPGLCPPSSSSFNGKHRNLECGTKVTSVLPTDIWHPISLRQFFEDLKPLDLISTENLVADRVCRWPAKEIFECPSQQLAGETWTSLRKAGMNRDFKQKYEFWNPNFHTYWWYGKQLELSGLFERPCGRWLRAG